MVDINNLKRGQFSDFTGIFFLRCGCKIFFIFKFYIITSRNICVSLYHQIIQNIEILWMNHIIRVNKSN